MVARKVLLPDQAFLDAIGLTAALSGAPTLHPVPRSPQFCWRVPDALGADGSEVALLSGWAVSSTSFFVLFPPQTRRDFAL